MNCERILIASVVFLAVGLGLIFGYTHGTVAFNAAYPVSGASLQVSINTTGMPAMAGLGAAVVGTILLVAALVLAIMREVPRARGIPKRENGPVP